MKLLKKDNIIGIVLILGYMICVFLFAVFIYNKTVENEDFLNSYIRYLFIAFVPLGLLIIFSEKLIENLTLSSKLKESIPLSLVTILSIPYVGGIIAWLSYLFKIIIVLIIAFWKILAVVLAIYLALIFGSYLRDKIFHKQV
ncbi:MAG: hypothetical protein KDE33_24395 [Bacteroidetes bacterium]|nr:hypothetical protein [Bacteroidota bacterium]